MSNILILHGPTQHEIGTAYKVSRFLEAGTSHKFPALVELSIIENGVSLNFLSNFVSDDFINPTIIDSAEVQEGEGHINLAYFLFKLIDSHKKVIILPSHHLLDNDRFVLAIGYALGKGKILGSLTYPHGVVLPDWYTECLKNTVSSYEDLLRLAKKI